MFMILIYCYISYIQKGVVLLPHQFYEKILGSKSKNGSAKRRHCRGERVEAKLRSATRI